MNKYFYIIFCVFITLYNTAISQITPKSYERADSVMKLNELVYSQVSEINWIDSTNSFWYRIKTRDGMKYQVVDVVKLEKKEAFDTDKLVLALNKKLNEKISAKDIVLSELKINQDENKIQFKFKNAHWICTLDDYSLIKTSLEKSIKTKPYWNKFSDKNENRSVVSPDSVWTAFTKEYNVYIRNNENEKEFQLSYDGSPGEFYSSYFSWSPDSKKLAVNKVRDYYKRYITLIESSPKSQLQPITQKRYYPKPGDAIPIKHPALFDIQNKIQIPVNTSGFELQYNLTNPKWNKDGTAFTFEFNQRGHQVYQVVAVDALSGDVRVVIDERSNTFIDYSGKNFRYDLEDSNEIIWASERDGWNHLYLLDSKTGSVKNKITNGDWVVRKVLHVDEKRSTIFFYGSGKNAKEDPYFLHCYRVNFDGSGLTDLTSIKRNHKVSFSKKFDYFTDTYSTVNMPPETVVRRSSDGKILMKLEKTDISDLFAKGWIAPEVFVAKGRDGKTNIWGNIYRPTNFDKNKSYPIIEYIYAGPHSSFAQKNFSPVNSAFSSLSELGFIIVQMDGMGTSNRSKAFHDVCWKNLKDAGFPDRILWIKAAAKKYKYMDINRVGIFGGSAGGQSSLGGLLFHPEFYKAGVSSCGCHDNRMDKMWWNEQWMGYPIGPQYKECSNVENAYKLQGRLMLIVGEMDDNVDPSSTMQVVDALIKAKKEFELVVLPGTNHTLGGTFGERKRRDFFIRFLLKQKTPEWNVVTNDKSIE